MRLTTTKGREFAFKVQKKRRKIAKHGTWRVGISFNTHLAIDLDKGDLNNAVILGRRIQEIHKILFKIRKIVDVYKTGKGYWLIMRYVPNDIVRKMWAICLNNFRDEEICKDFLKISLKYNKATLRVSKKNGNIPKKIGFIACYGKFVTKKQNSVEETAKTTVSHTAISPDSSAKDELAQTLIKVSA